MFGHLSSGWRSRPYSKFGTQPEERAASIRAIAPPGCVPLPRGRRGRGRVWVLAHGSPCDSTAGLVQRVLRLDRPSSLGGIANRLTRSNRRGTDPYARWCGRGGAARLPPIPIRTRVLTEGVTPSLHIDYKHSRIKQFHKEGRALRTETTINDARDFGIGKRLSNLPALRRIGFQANRRLLDVQRVSQDCAIG